MRFLALCQRSSLIIIVLAGTTPGRAASDTQVQHSFVIPPADGYGVGDCLSTGGACGRIVADSWCEANGLGKAVSFGSSDDTTGAIAEPAKSAPRIASGSFIINCGD